MSEFGLEVASSAPGSIARVDGGLVPGAELQVAIAATALQRLVGLLGHSGLAEASGLLIRPCSSVHTAGMRFPIDVVYLDRQECVVKVVSHLWPWRVSFGGRNAHSTLELAAGEASCLGIVCGASIRFSE